MADTKQEYAEILLRIPDIRFPQVYTKGKGFGDMPGKHSVTFDADVIEPGLRSLLFRCASKSNYSARSNLAPIVSEIKERYDLMVMVFEEADVRNIPRDRLLRGIPATLRVRPVDVSHPHFGDFMILTLVGLTVDVDDMRNNLRKIGADEES